MNIDEFPKLNVRATASLVSFLERVNKLEARLTLAKMKKKAKKSKRVKRVKGKRAVALPLTTVWAVGPTRSTATTTSYKPAKKRPVLIVTLWPKLAGCEWQASKPGSPIGVCVLRSAMLSGSEKAALADARRVLERYCAECDVRFPK